MRYKKTNSLDNLLEKTLSSLKNITETKNIFGEPIETKDDTVIIPVSKVSIGFVIGGGEYSDLSTRRVGVSYPMAGGSGGGICLKPVGFLVSTKEQVKYIPISEDGEYEKLIDSITKFSDFLMNKISKKEERKNDKE